MNPTDARRVVQVFLPHVPMPVVDYAISIATPFAAISSGGAMTAGASQGGQLLVKKKGGPIADRFALRHMESGDFGEFGLDVPRGKNLKRKAQQFTDPGAWSFAMATTAGDGASSTRRS